MKHFVIFAILLIGSNALDQEFIEKWMEKMQELGQVCAEETHATSDDIAELVEFKTPSTHEGQCMIFCMQKKLHMMQEDGSIDKVGSILTLDDLRAADFELYKKILGVFVKCGEKAKIYDDPCKTASELAACGQAEARAVGIDESMMG